MHGLDVLTIRPSFSDTKGNKMKKNKLALSICTGGLLLSNQSFAVEDNCYTKMSYQVDIAQCQYEIYPDPETEVAISYTKTLEDQSYCRTLYQSA